MVSEVVDFLTSPQYFGILSTLSKALTKSIKWKHSYRSHMCGKVQRPVKSQNNTWSLMQMLGYLPHSDSKQSDSKEGAWSNILKIISIWLILCTAYSNTDMAFQYICTTKGSFNISKLVKYLQKLEFPKLGEPIHKELKQINWNSKVQ